MIVKLIFYDDIVYIDYFNNQTANGSVHTTNQIIEYPNSDKNRYELSACAHEFIKEKELELLAYGVGIIIEHKDGVSPFYGK